MTVTKGKRNYSFPVNSGNTSEAESLQSVTLEFSLIFALKYRF